MSACKLCGKIQISKTRKEKHDGQQRYGIERRADAGGQGAEPSEETIADAQELSEEMMEDVSGGSLADSLFQRSISRQKKKYGVVYAMDPEA